MKKLLLFGSLLFCSCAHAQVATNINVTVGLTQVQFDQIKVAVNTQNFIRTNSVPALPAITPKQVLQEMLDTIIERFVIATKDAAQSVLAEKFTEASPAKQAAALNALK